MIYTAMFLLFLAVIAVVSVVIYTAVSNKVKETKQEAQAAKGKYGLLINPFQEVNDRLPSPAPPGYNWELRVEKRDDGFEYIVLGKYNMAMGEVELQYAACLTYNFAASCTYQELYDHYGFDETKACTEESIVDPIIKWAKEQYPDVPVEYDYTMKA